MARLAGRQDTDNDRLGDRIANALRDAIVDGEILPGTWLGEEALAKEYRVSRTPVREALMRLMAEGLLTAGPNRGLVVTSVSLEEVAALYVVQEALDGVAARLAAERHNADVEMQLEHNLDAMRHACQAKEVDNVVRINREFHALVRTAAANPYVDRFLTEVEHRFRRFPPDDVQSRALEAVEEHAAIVEAIKRGDGKAAESAAVHHQRKAKEARIRNLLGYVG